MQQIEYVRIYEMWLRCVTNLERLIRLFNRLFYLIESSDSLEGRFLLLTLPCHAMKVLRRWRISARDAKSRPVPSPDLINWLETGGEKTPLFAPRNSESVRQSSSNISPNISGLSEATTILSPFPHDISDSSRVSR